MPRTGTATAPRTDEYSHSSRTGRGRKTNHNNRPGRSKKAGRSRRSKRAREADRNRKISRPIYEEYQKTETETKAQKTLWNTLKGWTQKAGTYGFWGGAALVAGQHFLLGWKWLTYPLIGALVPFGVLSLTLKEDKAAQGDNSFENAITVLKDVRARGGKAISENYDKNTKILKNVINDLENLDNAQIKKLINVTESALDKAFSNDIEDYDDTNTINEQKEYLENFLDAIHHKLAELSSGVEEAGSTKDDEEVIDMEEYSPGKYREVRKQESSSGKTWKNVA